MHCAIGSKSTFANLVIVGVVGSRRYKSAFPGGFRKVSSNILGIALILAAVLLSF